MGIGQLLGVLTKLAPIAAKLLPFLGAGLAYVAGRRGAKQAAKMQALETDNEAWRRRLSYGEELQQMDAEELKAEGMKWVRPE